MSEAVEALRARTSTAFIVSLDVRKALAPELGIDSFLSTNQRDIARGLIREHYIFRTEYPDIEAVADHFEEAVLQSEGPDTLEKIRSWQHIAYPSRKDRLLLENWIFSLMLLCQEWDDPDSTKIMPLLEPELAWARIRIRNYIDALSNNRTELEGTFYATGSDWDLMLDRWIEEEDRTEGNLWFDWHSSLIDILKLRTSWEFWVRLRRDLPSEMLEALHQWTRDEMKAWGGGVRYTGIPKPRRASKPPWGDRVV